VGSVLSGSAAPAAAGIHFDFEPRAFAPLDHYVKDHTVIQHQGLFHLIYTTGTDPLGRWSEPGNEVHFGHATSTDLRHWTVHPPVLAGPHASWESRNRWAPQIIRLPGGGFRLYYTGVNEHIAQAIGVAESPTLDLATDPFVPIIDNPIFRPDTSWASWSTEDWSNGRDPFLFEHEDAWWMLVTAATRDGRGALALARSSDGGRSFEDQGPILIGGMDELESPQLVEIGGRWFLIFTSGRESSTWVIEGPGPFGPWNYAARARWLETIAPEVWRMEASPRGNGESISGSWWISTHENYSPHMNGPKFFLLGFDRLRLGPAGLEIVEESGLGEDWPDIEGDAFTAQPTLGDNLAARGEPSVDLVGRGYLGSNDYFTWPPERPGRIRGYAATGVIRSRPFVLGGRVLSLRVGGSANLESVYVALRRTTNDEILFRETGRGVDAMDERIWDIGPLRGTEVVIEIADLDPHGRINVDEIVEIDDGPGEPGPALRLIHASPNPFRDSITLRIGVVSPTDLAGTVVTIHDVSGRRLRALPPTDHGDGMASVIWDAVDDRGQPVASGVYFARLRAGATEEVARIVHSP
jgi:beta-fructofuranosidase